MEYLLPLQVDLLWITSASPVRPLFRSLNPLHRARRELRPCCPPPSIFLSFPRWISQACARAPIGRRTGRPRGSNSSAVAAASIWSHWSMRDRSIAQDSRKAYRACFQPLGCASSSVRFSRFPSWRFDCTHKPHLRSLARLAGARCAVGRLQEGDDRL
ncbi:hypothetical protein HETIRDRAFT_147652 [Heterobasidion irregulare TC 32-1]|uniref:Uncharacterized protein n=1 Tax=Heterobasidion irregulare (strain TC 32-1) TaxID=747525 RepID=W4K732_HETIT|nr:uncharacterized protein HETIRDRAFT_147652 [Heterobasidion irregulare TC 32-1]ETW81647.1 hypothetical protein HETIRDRAFT_147652 [Heterobasidion irregulare TC 32-1]